VAFRATAAWDTGARLWTARSRRSVKKAGKASGLLLTFYVDGALRDNAVLLPAYPSGFSYSRPFRYGPHRIQADLRADLADQPRAYERLAGVVAMRFKDPALGFVALRQVRLTHIEIAEDISSVAFRLDPFYAIPDGATLADLVTPFPEGVGRGPELFLRVPQATVERPLSHPEEDVEQWSRLVRAIAAERTLPLQADTRNAIFFHARRPRRRKPLPVRPVHSSWAAGPRYGGRLPEHSEAEVVVLHRVPALDGTETAPRAFDVAYRSSTDDIGASPADETYSANYERHVVSLASRAAGDSWTELVVDPKEEEVAAQDGTPLSVTALRLPLGTRVALMHRATRNWLPILLLFAAFFVAAYVAGLDRLKNDRGAAALVAGASAAASLIIFLFKR